MTLEFDQEVILLNGCLVAGTVTVEDLGDGLEAIAFEPEDGRKGCGGPTWSRGVMRGCEKMRGACNEYSTERGPASEKRGSGASRPTPNFISTVGIENA